MKNMNDANIVENQYKNADKLNIRIALHERYSTNKVPFGDWIVSNYNIKTGSRVLELGCGTGSMWKNHLHLLENGSTAVLSDFSEGMLNEAKENLGEQPNLEYQIINIQDIPYDDESFDVVIANMMLYHVPDLKKGLSEVARVLKNDGTFYCATYGENGIVQYLEGLLHEYGVNNDMNKSFTLQNGEGKLREYFGEVIRLDREDGLEITNLDDFIEYIYSTTRMANIADVDRDTLEQILRSRMVDGVIYIPKEYGMFVARKEINGIKPFEMLDIRGN